MTHTTTDGPEDSDKPDRAHGATSDPAGDAGSESPEEGEAAMDAARDAVSGEEPA